MSIVWECGRHARTEPLVGCPNCLMAAIGSAHRALVDACERQRGGDKTGGGLSSEIHAALAAIDALEASVLTGGTKE